MSAAKHIVKELFEKKLTLHYTSLNSMQCIKLYRFISSADICKNLISSYTEIIHTKCHHDTGRSGKKGENWFYLFETAFN